MFGLLLLLVLWLVGEIYEEVNRYVKKGIILILNFFVVNISFFEMLVINYYEILLFLFF